MKKLASLLLVSWPTLAHASAVVRGSPDASAAPPSIAEPAPTPPAAAPIGWVKRGRSLLLYDKDHNVAAEIGLEKITEGGLARVTSHEIRGDAAGAGRFAWVYERTTVYNASRSKELESHRLLRILGSDGQELWTSAEADAPKGAEPVLFSGDGEVILVSLHPASAWHVAAKGYLGETIMDIGPLPQLERMFLTKNGRFALARWVVPDVSATHTFLDLKAKKRKDVASEKFQLGAGEVGEDGKVVSGGKLVLDLQAKDDDPK